MEELASLKTQLADSEKLRLESDEKLQILTDRYQQDTQALKGQLEDVRDFARC